MLLKKEFAVYLNFFTYTSNYYLPYFDNSFPVTKNCVSQHDNYVMCYDVKQRKKCHDKTGIRRGVENFTLNIDFMRFSVMELDENNSHNVIFVLEMNL